MTDARLVTLWVPDANAATGRRLATVEDVSVWLRNQGAIDYEAAERAVERLLNGAYAWDIMPPQLARAVVDAALGKETDA